MNFPGDFTWGCATSSYQIEGAWQEGGKGLSIWDAFTHTPGKIRGGSNADVACDHYHRYKDDVALMADLGLSAYRFSISWPRIQPTGNGKPNVEGLRFYSDLVDELLEHGITPWVTLYHWDLPVTLQLESDGWLNPGIADHFAEYAEICFEHLGDRVKHWITLNEPWVVAILGYGHGVFAPGRVSKSEPYLAGHNLLRAHAKAVDVYRTRYQSQQNGSIGISNNCDWREPLTDSTADRAAATTALEFFLGWFADPIYGVGEYPESMRTNLGNRLPEFTANERYLLNGSADFFGLNHYTTLYASFPEPGRKVEADVYGNGGIIEDQNVVLSTDDSWERTTMGWSVVPWGCEKLLLWIDERYDRPVIYMTENGAAYDDAVIDGVVDDGRRIDFLRQYVSACRSAMDQGVNLKGYFVWSLMDNFEWARGYSQRFGLYHTDFQTLKRTPKNSARWYRDLIAGNTIPRRLTAK